MTKPMIKILDVITQEETFREMTDEEYAQYLIDQQNFEIEQAERDAKKAEEDAAKAALQAQLENLGITPELIDVIKKL